MHFVTAVNYESEYTLRLCFEDGSVKLVDLKHHLAGKIFEPLKDVARFRSARLNPDIDTVVWENGADMSPDFLYELGAPAEGSASRRVAETRAVYPDPKP